VTDYTRSTGSTGTMMIRDTGTTCEFWLKAGSQTYNHQLPWAYIANGVSSPWREHDFVAGGEWQRLGGVSVTTSQTVTFKLGDTGTSGLGGPTNFSVAISRATAPPAPTAFAISSVASTSATGDSNSNGNGGSALLQWQIKWSTNPDVNVNSPFGDATLSTGSKTVTGLALGTTYYFWARVRNAIGWSPWSVRSSAKTWTTPSKTSSVTLTNVTQTTVDASFTVNVDGGTPILERQIGYGTNSTSPTTTVTSDGSTTITGLSAGLTYFFWARARNSVGWSAWSAVSSTKMIAGARLKVGTVYKDAVPYVRTGGIWKVARPWARLAGVWKQSV
jgi:hypothetical protein